MSTFSYKSIRTFIGAKDYDISRAFYNEIGWKETILSEKMSVFRVDERHSFYLQKAYVRKWIDNTMVFLEVDDVEACYAYIKSLNLPDKFPKAKLSEIVTLDWGREFFLHDPSGVLWHLGEFNK